MKASDILAEAAARDGKTYYHPHRPKRELSAIESGLILLVREREERIEELEERIRELEQGRAA